METGNRLTAAREQTGRGKGGKKGNGVVRTCMSDPWTWTMVRGLTVGVGDGLGGGGQKGKNWDNCNGITIIK